MKHVTTTREIDVVICDIRMPGMSGIEALAQLKAIDPAIEVIMLTAYETLETAREALRLGACDYLSKPYDVALMRAKDRLKWGRMRILQF